MTSHQGVFLDRDGVINKLVYRSGKPTSPRSIEEFAFEEGAASALDRLSIAGFKLFVVTNQPELARGLLTKQALTKMTDLILGLPGIAEVRICTHDDHDRCKCRKPEPGMLIDLAHRHRIALEESYIVGDTWRDSGAGNNAGCKSIILDRPYNQSHPADWRVAQLSEAVDLILARDSQGRS